MWLDSFGCHTHFLKIVQMLMGHPVNSRGTKLIKVAFFQKVRFGFELSKRNNLNHYPELEFWISCLLLCAGNPNFKFRIVRHEILYNESILVSFRSKGENTELEKTSKRCWSLHPDVTRMPPWCHNFKITLSEEPLPTYQFRFYKRTLNILSGMS